MSDILNQLRYWQDRANHAEEKAKQEAASAAELEAESKRLREALENITELGLQHLPVDKRWGTAFAFAREALKGGK